MLFFALEVWVVVVVVVVVAVGCVGVTFVLELWLDAAQRRPRPASPPAADTALTLVKASPFLYPPRNPRKMQAPPVMSAIDSFVADRQQSH